MLNILLTYKQVNGILYCIVNKERYLLWLLQQMNSLTLTVGAGMSGEQITTVSL